MVSNLKKQNNGLTLVEIAIVLVILGLLIGVGASLIGPLTKRAKLQESRETVKQAKESFTGYAVKNGYLPQESIYDPNSPVQAFQNVGTKGIDAWGKPLRYIAANEIEGSSINICAVNATTLTINDRGTPHSNIAFVIVSGGENYNIQTENIIYEIGTPNIDDFTSDMNRPEEYDDIVIYVSLDEIRALRGCPKEVDIDAPTVLSSAEEDSYYSYSFKVTGGYPPYTWTAAGLPSYLSIDSSSGFLSGIINYKATSSTGELDNCNENISNIQITVTDSSSPPQSKTRIYSIPVKPKPLKIITDSLPTGYEGSSYSVNLFANGGRSLSYNWSLSSGSLPSGLTLSTTGIISGTIASDTGCSQPSPSNFTVSLNDGCGNPVYKGFTITVNDPDCTSGGGGGCTAYRAWNQTGATRDFTVSGTCRNSRANGAEITSITITLTSGGQISRHSSTAGNCTSPILQTLNYSQAVLADTDGDCQVNFTLSGFTDR